MTILEMVWLYLSIGGIWVPSLLWGIAMSRRNFRITVFSIIMALLALLGYAWQSDAPQEPMRVALPNAGGLVVFEHQRHAGGYGVECQACHHTGTYTECGACHGIVMDKEFVQTHRAKFNDVVDCLVCHHRATPDAVANLERFSRDGNVDFKAFDVKCASCHKDVKLESLVPNRMNAFHDSCMKCHEKLGKGPYTKEQCSQCHTK